MSAEGSTLNHVEICTASDNFLSAGLHRTSSHKSFISNRKGYRVPSASYATLANSLDECGQGFRKCRTIDSAIGIESLKLARPATALPSCHMNGVPPCVVGMASGTVTRTEGSCLSNAPKGNGIRAKGSQNQTQVLRTMPSREKQGF